MTLAPPAAPVAVSLRGALERADAGLRIDVDDAEALLAADGDDLDRLIRVAGRLRDAGLEASGRPGVITYSRKVFVPLTTLCRDRCHYCVFVDTPGQLLKKRKSAFMSPDQVLAIVRQGAAHGCKEALLTLGDRPEERWPEARAWLDEHGYASTLDYVGEVARLITAETGLLAHLNPGVMSATELAALRPVAPSMGMMLETTSTRLFTEPGQVHFGSPDKDPAVRLAVVDDAGRARIPFTTGILVGIGETLRDRAESLVALRDSHERWGHLQEVIVQNFRAKPQTAMAAAPDASEREYLAAVAVARVVLGARMRVQVPPNLSSGLDLLAAAGADDWGGVSPLTADHVNPERPWPHLDDLAERTAELGFRLEERLTAHPEYVADAAEWIDPSLHAAVAALADPVTGLAHVAPDDSVALPAPAHPRPLHFSASALPIDGADAEKWSARGDVGSEGRRHEGPGDARRGDARPGDAHRGDAHRGDAHRGDARRGDARAGHDRSAIRRLAERAAADPVALDDAEWVALLEAAGDDLDHLAATADDLRRYTVGEAISIVVNRNLTTSGLGTLFDLDDIAAIARDAADLGATELCVQGLAPEPDDYEAVARAVKTATPGIHLHAYRPQDVRDLADRGGLGLDGALTALQAAGVDTVPGTGVKVLSERVRQAVAPGDLPVELWLEGIRAAHRAGLRSTSVLFYGHVETAAERIAHLRTLRAIQDETGGFTEFVPIPLPGPAGGVPLVAGRAPLDEHRAMVAVSRLALSGSIPHVQIPWTRVGTDAAATLLRSGGDDLGGTLLDGRVKPEAGVEHGLELPLAAARRLAARMFRPLRQRTTGYEVAG